MAGLVQEDLVLERGVTQVSLVLGEGMTMKIILGTGDVPVRINMRNNVKRIATQKTPITGRAENIILNLMENWKRWGSEERPWPHKENLKAWKPRLQAEDL